MWLTRKDEYVEAGNLFRSGLGVISSIITTFTTMSGILLAGTGAALNSPDPFKLYIVCSIAFIGLVAAVVAFFTHRRMTVYLRAWLARAREIEQISNPEISNGDPLTTASVGDQDQTVWQAGIYSVTYEIEVASRTHFFSQSYKWTQASYFIVGLFWIVVLAVALLRLVVKI